MQTKPVIVPHSSWCTCTQRTSNGQYRRRWWSQGVLPLTIQSQGQRENQNDWSFLTNNQLLKFVFWILSLVQGRKHQCKVDDEVQSFRIQLSQPDSSVDSRRRRIQVPVNHIYPLCTGILAPLHNRHFRTTLFKILIAHITTFIGPIWALLKEQPARSTPTISPAGNHAACSSGVTSWWDSPMYNYGRRPNAGIHRITWVLHWQDVGRLGCFHELCKNWFQTVWLLDGPLHTSNKNVDGRERYIVSSRIMLTTLVTVFIPSTKATFYCYSSSS